MNRAIDECIGGFQRPRSLEEAKRLWKTWKGLEPIDPIAGRCKSYIDGEFEKEHKSKTDAVMHLK